MNTYNLIIKSAMDCLAQRGYAGTSMRDIAALAQVQTSAIYYHFPDKSALFEAVYKQIIVNLQQDVEPIRRIADPSERLRAVIAYQLRKRKMLAALLNYFVAQADNFPKSDDGGYVPAGAYRHILETLEIGAAKDLYRSHTSPIDAKIIAHIMNGFIIEYANRPLPKKQSEALVEAIADFIEAATKQTSQDKMIRKSRS